MKIIVCGGREYKDRARLFDYLDRMHQRTPITHLIAGGAQGADSLAQLWSDQRGIPNTIVPADWQRHGRRAGYLRNVEMADLNPDFVVAFPGGVGTDMMVKIATDRKIPGVRVGGCPR